MEYLDVDKIKELDRYKDFIFFDNPRYFDEWFKDKNYEVVQLHDMTATSGNNIVGFVGDIKWENNKLSSLDGDSYYAHMLVFGYSEFEWNNKKCLDILVKEW